MAGHYDDNGAWVDDGDPYQYADYTNPDGSWHSYDPGTGQQSTGGSGDPLPFTPYDPNYNPNTGPTPAPTGVVTPPPTPGAPTPPPAPSPLGPFTGVFRPPTPSPYPSFPTMGPPPEFVAPEYTPPQAFKAPSIDEALMDPSYNFRKGQGEESLQRWAAARGTLNDSGTAKALLDYGQNAASQEYGNIWNREFNAYNTNYKTQFVDPYSFAYQATRDRYEPQLTAWSQGNDNARLGYSTQFQATQHDNDFAYQNAWNAFQDEYKRWNDDAERRIRVATA